MITVDASRYPYLNEIEWEDVKKCPCCGKLEPFQFLWSYRLKDKTITFNFCTNCGVGFLNPRMSDAYTDKFYKDIYPKYHHQWNDLEKITQQRRAETFLELLGDRKIDRHLDIGSSAGFLVHAVGDKYGNAGTGIEPDEGYRRYAIDHQEFGVFFPDTDWIKDETFDLITMSHVLEHINHPYEYLKDLLDKHLAKGGTLALEVPNGDVYLASYLIHHPIIFNETSITNLMRRLGFGKIAVCTHNGATEYPTKLYLSALCWDRD